MKYIAVVSLGSCYACSYVVERSPGWGRDFPLMDVLARDSTLIVRRSRGCGELWPRRLTGSSLVALGRNAGFCRQDDRNRSTRNAG